MKKIIFTIMLVLILSLAAAHPAAKMSGRYDTKTQLFYLNYKHGVRNAADHYIGKVNLWVNGKAVLTQLLYLQENDKGGNLVYKIPSLKSGDQILVKTECNKGGVKTYKLTL